MVQVLSLEELHKIFLDDHKYDHSQGHTDFCLISSFNGSVKLINACSVEFLLRKPNWREYKALCCSGKL